MEALSRRHIFEVSHPVDATFTCVRFCTSWSTTPQDVAALLADIEAL